MKNLILYVPTLIKKELCPYLGGRPGRKVIAMLSLLGNQKSRKKTTVFFTVPIIKITPFSYLVAWCAHEAQGHREPNVDRIQGWEPYYHAIISDPTC